MSDLVEEGTDVHFQYPVKSPASLFAHGNRMMGGFIRSISVRVRMKDGIKMAFSISLDCALSYPIA